MGIRESYCGNVLSAAQALMVSKVEQGGEGSIPGSPLRTGQGVGDGIAPRPLAKQWDNSNGQRMPHSYSQPTADIGGVGRDASLLVIEPVGPP